MSFLAAALLMTCLPSALIDFAWPKWKADKAIRIDDAYKWTYQATRGGEHAVPDIESARKWLTNEWSNLSEKKSEPIWQPLCPDGDIGRLNLRPFKDRNGDKEELLDAFLNSSRDYRSDGANFLAAWNELGKRLKKNVAGNLDHKSWLDLDARMRAKNYPAIHHSDDYNKANAPAYRIITMAEAKKLLAIVE